MSLTPGQLRAEAEAAAAGLPTLLLSAERLAAALVMGAHGQRRAGTGEDFWQYRPASSGDAVRSIDWRRSARTDAQYVRDREAQQAQSAVLWVSAGQGMDFSGGPDRPTKLNRARLLALALGLALLNAGDRVALAGQPPRLGRTQGDRIAEDLLRHAVQPGDDDPLPVGTLRPGQRMIVLDDFLGDPAPVVAMLEQAAAMGVRGALLQVLDPDEEAFPYQGAVLFRSGSGAATHDTRDAGGLRAAYLARLKDRRAHLTRAADQAGWHFGTHDTAAAPGQALMWLWSVLEG
ncbi:DUF58 domain-containing protein [Paracoccus sulfuroxidans]|uniref:Uncharacterized protein DUF58 n=1 Tax=Paracoccus sulfuroxidans TaxID=384678 RepID=A0A562NYI7_9RHOB|nr:DUF58 domain-containing protein [Paracoccus sulfuroxidans]TWI36796.1 uncharacterized protein DUF58 [Paracoccus sulfuroxidans]